MLLVLRGVSKTVLLNCFAGVAETIGNEQAQLQAPEGRPLANYLVPALKSILLRLKGVEHAKVWVGDAMAGLQGFAGAFKVSMGDLKLSLNGPMWADSGNLEVHMPELLVSTAHVVQADGTRGVILIDEVQ
jgi:hypothetical protein